MKLEPPLADISHPSGLIATGLLSNPFRIVMWSQRRPTNVACPRGGLILMGEDFDNPLELP